MTQRPRVEFVVMSSSPGGRRTVMKVVTPYREKAGDPEPQSTYFKVTELAEEKTWPFIDGIQTGYQIRDSEAFSEAVAYSNGPGRAAAIVDEKALVLLRRILNHKGIMEHLTEGDKASVAEVVASLEIRKGAA